MINSESRTNAAVNNDRQMSEVPQQKMIKYHKAYMVFFMTSKNT